MATVFTAYIAVVSLALDLAVCVAKIIYGNSLLFKLSNMAIGSLRSCLLGITSRQLPFQLIIAFISRFRLH